MVNMTATAATNWALLTGGDMWGAITSVYTIPLGFWFYAIIMLFTMGMVQLKTQNFSITTIIGIMVSAAAIPFMPEYTYGIINVMMALGIMMILYKLFK